MLILVPLLLVFKLTPQSATDMWTRSITNFSHPSYVRSNATKCMMALSGVRRVAACRKSFLQEMVAVLMASMAACMMTEVLPEILGTLDVER